MESDFQYLQYLAAIRDVILPYLGIKGKRGQNSISTDVFEIETQRFVLKLSLGEGTRIWNQILSIFNI